MIDKVIRKILRKYRSHVFRKKTKNSEFPNVIGNAYINASNIRYGKNITIYPGVFFWGDGEIIIGNNVDIGVGTVIFAKKRIIIGDNVSIAAHCYIIDSNHGTKSGELINKQPLEFDEWGVIIENDVWISAGCKIIKGAILREGCVIGALSLVNNEISPNCIAVGIPAKIIKKRHNETI